MKDVRIVLAEYGLAITEQDQDRLSLLCKEFLDIFTDLVYGF